MATLQEYNETTSREERKLACFARLYIEANRVGLRRRITFLLRNQQDQQQVDDLEQTTWLKAWQHLDPEQRITFAWLSRIATNTVIDWLRHTYLMNHCTQLRPQPITLEDVENSLLQEDFTEAVLDRVRITRALACLKPDERRVFHLWANGYAYQEISEITGLPISTVNWLLHQWTKRACRPWHKDAV